MFNSYKLMFSYMKTIKQILPKINNHFKINEANYAYSFKEIKLDNVYRMYTVLNFPPKTVKNIQLYGHKFLDNETAKFISELNTQFKAHGLFELVALTRVDMIGENNVLVVVEYKLIDIKKLFLKMIISVFSILGLLTSYLFL